MASRNNQRSTPAQRPAQRTVQTNAGPNPMGRPVQSKPPTINQNLKIAGTSGITKQELQNISKTTGKSSAQVIQKLDALNRKIKGRDQVGISLNSGAANMLIRQAKKQGPGMDNFLGLGKSTFGTGKIGQALQGMVGTRETGGYINPQSGQQSRTSGTDRTILPRGIDLMSSGRKTVRGIGKQYTVPNQLMQSGTLAPTTGDGTSPEGTNLQEDSSAAPEMLPTPPLEEEQKPKDQMMLSNFDAALANWATGFKTARSSRKRAGRGAQTLGGSTRVIPTGGFRGGV